MPGTKTSAPSHVRCSCTLGKGHVKCPCLLCPWNNVPYLKLTPRLCRLFIQTFRMFRKSNNLKYLLSLVPGKQRFGTYRFLPIFFCIGGVMEWIMINVRIGRETFYDVYRRKRSEREYQQKIADGLIVPIEPAAK